MVRIDIDALDLPPDTLEKIRLRVRLSGPGGAEYIRHGSRTERVGVAGQTTGGPVLFHGAKSLELICP